MLKRRIPLPPCLGIHKGPAHKGRAMDKDYISVLEAAKIVKMSPSRFANLLREEREQLPVELNYELVNQLGNCHAQRGFSLKINGNWLEKIYDKGFDMVGHFPILMIHRLDWKNFLSNRKKGVMMPLHHKPEEAQARITELETELATCREQLEKARREISGKEELTPKAKKSYLTIIAALCNKKQSFDIDASSAVSVLETEIEKIGLTLGDDTIRKIIKEVRDIVAS